MYVMLCNQKLTHNFSVIKNVFDWLPDIQNSSLQSVSQDYNIVSLTVTYVVRVNFYTLVVGPTGLTRLRTIDLRNLSKYERIFLLRPPLSRFQAKFPRVNKIAMKSVSYIYRSGSYYCHEICWKQCAKKYLYMFCFEGDISPEVWILGLTSNMPTHTLPTRLRPLQS